MGRSKALLPWGQVPLLQHLAQEVHKAGIDQVVAVGGARYEGLLPVAREAGIATCPNPLWETGMGSSLATGLQWMQNQAPETEAALILLADQPLVGSEYLAQMLREHRAYPDLVIATDYKPFPGVPALFPRAFWESLLALPRGEGAKTFLRSIARQCRILEGGDAVIDIDTPEAYSRALERAGLAKHKPR
jgi:molybdenum cofactor cytidylyltransferase